MSAILNDNEALKAAFNNLGDDLAALHELALAEAQSKRPDPVMLARVVRDLIESLRTIFPATDTWRQVGEIAETEVVPKLRERMTSPPTDH